MTLLQQQPIAYLTLFIALGLALGSYGNVLIYRLINNQPFGGRSKCPHCRHTLAVTDLVPVFSWLLLKAKCRYCGHAIAGQYPLVELLCAGLFALALHLSTSWLAALLLALALWLLLLIAVIDIKIKSIPDALNLPFVFISILYYWNYETVFESSAFAIGIGFFFAQWLISSGRWMGSGDVLLSVGLSAILGTPAKVIFMIFAAYIIGAAYATVRLALHQIGRKDHIAFVPFLALGTLLSIIISPQLVECINLIKWCLQWLF